MLRAMTVEAQTADRIAGALLGVAIGDAVGLAPPGALLDASGELPVAAGGTTDAVLALAALLACGEPPDAEDVARALAQGRRSDRGLDGATVEVLDAWAAGEGAGTPSRRAFAGRGSPGLGAAGWIAPVAARFFDDDILVVKYARRVAAVTHSHSVGLELASAVAGAIAAAIDGRGVLPGAQAAVHAEPVAGALRDAAAGMAAGGIDLDLVRSPVALGPAMIAIAATEPSFEAIISAARRSSGERSAACAVAGAIGGARLGAAAIPGAWRATVERDAAAAGRDVRALARELARLALAPMSSGLHAAR